MDGTHAQGTSILTIIITMNGRSKHRYDHYHLLYVYDWKVLALLGGSTGRRTPIQRRSRHHDLYERGTTVAVSGFGNAKCLTLLSTETRAADCSLNEWMNEHMNAWIIIRACRDGCDCNNNQLTIPPPSADDKRQTTTTCDERWIWIGFEKERRMILPSSIRYGTLRCAAYINSHLFVRPWQALRVILDDSLIFFGMPWKSDSNKARCAFYNITMLFFWSCAYPTTKWNEIKRTIRHRSSHQCDDESSKYRGFFVWIYISEEEKKVMSKRFWKIHACVSKNLNMNQCKSLWRGKDPACKHRPCTAS